MKLTPEELKTLVEEVKAENSKNLIKESGFPRVRQIMLGQIPSIDTLGILTAENPMGKPHSKAENELRNKELMTDLRSMNYGPIPIQGRFGGPESSLLIPNITRDEAIKLGNKHQQEAVIWGQRISDQFSDPFLKFEYIEGDETIQTRSVSLGGDDAQSREDYFSAKKGRKFYIPFFDDEFEGVVPDEGGRRIHKNKDPYQDRLDNTETDTRLGPQSVVGTTPIVERKNCFFEGEVPNTKEAKTLAASIKMRTSLLAESARTKKSKWHHRGMIKEEMRKLQRLVDYTRNK